MSAQTTYPLSPLQQGMLFHALAEPHSGVDIEQLVFTLREALAPERMRAAWERVVTRHPILRTAFRTDGAEPLQEVSERVKVPFVVEDAPGMEDGQLTSWLRQDRIRGFAMETAPLLRFHLFRHGNEDWRLVWTFHHALLDGRSFPLLIEEAFGYYDQPDAAEPSLPRPYADFIAWHGEQQHAGAETFWREKLQGFRAPTPLAIEGLGELSRERQQGDAETKLSAEETVVLQTFAHESGVTLNTLVQAAWAVLLHRYSSEEDVCFGATRAGRRSNIEGAEEMIGLFINTVPVRVRASDERPLMEFLRELREAWVDVRPYEHTPLARVQAWSEVPVGQPLFRTLVVFENYDLASHFCTRGGPWGRRSLRLYEQTNFPICLAAYAGTELRLVAEYDRSRLDDSLIHSLLGHLRNLLTAMPAHRAGNLGDLPLLPPEEAEAMLAATTKDFPVSETLHTLFARQAARAPEAIALVQGDTRLTYAQLEARANAVAAHLAAQGVRHESIVGLCLERCPDLVVALLGILKANAAYLPIDLAYPPERLAFMLEDAQAPVLLTQRHLADRLPPEHGAKLVFIEDVALEGGDAPASGGQPEQLCYVLYTSGSTGKPKGCCLTHRNVARLFTATDDWFHFDAQDVWTLFHSTAFDFSVWEIWGALLYGGTLVVVPFEVSRSPEQFYELLVTEKVTVLNQTPSAFRQLVAAEAASEKPQALALRYVIFGGEALEMPTLQPWFERHGDAKPKLVNMYGITETTVHVTYRPLRAADVARGSVIGIPIPDLQLLVLDTRLRPVPVGVPGELFVGGAGLARGYHQRPELTAERFIPHPYEASARLYRTGDLARKLPDGDLEYLGRIDQQVKIRGFRIELGEIESVLLHHPRIRETAVLARDDGHGGKKLVAWIVENAQEPEASASQLRAHLKNFVPDYMVPSAFVRVERMPLTNNGKLDTRALPDPPEDRPITSEFTPATTPAELALAEIWQRVLKLQRISVHDNFFELGGDSILTILVVSQARQRGLALTPKLLFDHPTIAALAQRVSATSPKTASLADAPEEGEVPLTPIQRWFFAHNFPEPHYWNQSLALELVRPISRERLAAAFAQVMAVHPAFRLRYERTTAGWRQFFANDEKNATPALETEAASLQSEMRLDGPLLRYAWDAEKRRLTVAIHHFIIDGVSWRILLEDLDAALRGVPLGARTNGFQTWARALASAKPSPDEQVYRDNLPSPAPLPLDFASGENLESSAQTHLLSFSASETTALLRDLRMQDALLTALAHAMTDLTGQAEHRIEIEGHGREESALAELAALPAAPDVSRTIGWFTAIFPIRLRAAADVEATLAETTARLASVPRRGFGWMLLDDGPSKADVLFNYLGQFDQTVAGLEHFALAGLDTSDWHGPKNRRTHILEINCVIWQGRLEVRFTYSANLHRPETIAGLAERFASTLRELLVTPARFPLANIDTAPLKAILTRYPSVEDIYPLTPMQRLFLALETARPGSGSDQWHCRLVGPLDAERLRAAWNQLIQRHATLRTAYLVETAEPLQVVVSEARPEWHQEDLRHLPPAESEARISAYLAADAARPFDLSRPPLTRLALFQTGDLEQVLVWTHHHLEIDGWSWPLVFRELGAALEPEEGLPPDKRDPSTLPARYRDYVGWLAAQPDDSAFWRAHLASFRQATPLPLAETPGAGAQEVSVGLSPSESAALHALARQMHVTPNVLVQMAWALLLAHHGGNGDVVFGAAFSGRPADLLGSDSVIGHFVNNLPVRAQVSPEERLADFAARQHTQLSQLAEHQQASLQQIEACSGLPWSARLFSTLLVFQNYLATEMRLGGARVTAMHAPVRTNYPLTLVVNPGEEFTFTLIARPDVAAESSLRALAEELLSLLRAFKAETTLRELTHQLAPRAVTPARSSGPVTPGPNDTATEMERTIAGIWREAFGREVSVTQNFFDLGGHSLLMMRVHARLNATLGHDVPVVKLFQHPTIRTLARALGDPEPAGPSAAITAAQERAAKARAALARRPLYPRNP